MGENETLTILAVAAAAALVLLIWIILRQRRSASLRERFGDEYDRTVKARGGTGKAEADLIERETRVSHLDIRPLTATERDRFTLEWQETKALFVDSPAESVLRADRELAAVMHARGFPMADFDRRYEDLTVDHGDVARHYRDGHEITVKQGRGEASTEDLRQAMNHYERLFERLVSDVRLERRVGEGD